MSKMERSTKLAILVAMIVFCLLIIYIYVDPSASRLLPSCLFKRLTGYDCPSCGSQRALHILLNGGVKTAFWYNPFMFLVSPYVFAVIYSAIFDNRLARRIRPMVNSRIAVLLFMTFYFTWWIVRNTEWWQSLM